MLTKFVSKLEVKEQKSANFVARHKMVYDALKGQMGGGAACARTQDAGAILREITSDE